MAHKTEISMEKEERIMVRFILSKGLYLIGILLTIVIISIIIIINITPSEWSKDIATLHQINQKPMTFKVKYPSSNFYGYKYIKLDVSGVDKKFLNIEIILSVINLNKDEIGVVSNGFFSGDLSPNQESIIYKGKISDLDQYYNSNGAPYINHKKDDRKIGIKISSNQEVFFPQPLRLYTVSYADFTL